MFILKHRICQSILDEGADGGGGEQQQEQSNILDDSANLNSEATLNVEQFLTGFSDDDKEKATKYANNYVDEKGNLNVSNMIKSGFSLESRFGGFTGAPETYEMPIPEGFEGDIGDDDPYLQEFKDKAKSLNMSQDGFAELMDIHLRASIAPPVDVQEMAKEIGPEFNAMRANMAGFFKNRLGDDEFKSLEKMITSTGAFKTLYKVFQSSKPTKIDEAVRDNFSQSQFKDQMEAEFSANDEHGNPKMRDPLYAKSWRERWEPFINNN
jgi:hypothetical protein